MSTRQLNDWRKRANKLGNTRADERALLGVAATVCPKELGPFIDQFQKEWGSERIDMEEFEQAREEAREENRRNREQQRGN